MLKGRLEVAKKELETIKIKGHTGTWYEIDRRTLYGKTFYLMESEIYGDAAPGIIIDEAHEPVIEDVFDGFDHENVSTLDWISVYGKNICYDYLKKGSFLMRLKTCLGENLTRKTKPRPRRSHDC